MTHKVATMLVIALALAVCATGAERPAPAEFVVGRARVDITPPLGTGLAGYFHERVAESVRDKLYARAVAIKADDPGIAIVSCDLICVTEELVGAARELIQADTGLQPERVMICATHTHTGPEVRDSGSVRRDEAYVAGLPRKIADAVKAAAESAVPATLRCGTTQLTGYSFNRLFRLKDGTEVFGRRKGELGTAGPIEPELQTLSAVDRGGNLIALMVNFALHPDVIGGGSADFISADWPGMVGDNIAKVYGEDVVTLLLQGTCGDINHVVHEPTALPTRGPAKAMQIGRAVAGAAMVAAERAEPTTSGRLDVLNRTLDVPYYTRDEKFMDEIAELKKKEKLTNFERSLVRRGENWPYDNQVAKVPLQAFRIGDVSLVALPAEIFARIGMEIKEWSPTERTLVVELANARVTNYIPTTNQAERGAYGAKPIISRWLCSDAARRIADAAMVMLHELNDAP